jgi:hypothetical protein
MIVYRAKLQDSHLACFLDRGIFRCLDPSPSPTYLGKSLRRRPEGVHDREPILVHDQLDIPAVHSRHRWRDTPVGDRPRCAEVGLSIGVVSNERIGDLEDVAWDINRRMMSGPPVRNDLMQISSSEAVSVTVSCSIRKVIATEIENLHLIRLNKWVGNREVDVTFSAIDKMLGSLHRNIPIYLFLSP